MSSEIGNLLTFMFEGSTIRMATDYPGGPWFMFKDVAEALGYSKYRDVLANANFVLQPEEFVSIPVDTKAGKRDAVCINESGLYAFVMYTKKPEAQRLRYLVTSEILPSIIRTGSYIGSPSGLPSTALSVVQPPQPSPTIPVMIDAPSLARQFKGCKTLATSWGLKGNQALFSANAATKRISGIDCAELLGVTHLLNEEQEQHFTPTQLGQRLGVSPIAFNKMLEAAGFQVREPDHKGRPKPRVTESGMAHAVLLDTQKKNSAGAPVLQIHWKESVLEHLTLPSPEVTK